MKEHTYTSKEEGFCQDIANCKYEFDYQAYIAHYNSKAKMDSLYAIVARLRAKVKIRERISEIREANAKRNTLEVDDILHKMSALASIDIKDMFDEKGNLRSIHDMPDALTQFLSGFDVTQRTVVVNKRKTIHTRVTKVKFHDSLKLLDMWNKVLGNYASKKVDVTENITVKNYVYDTEQANRGLTLRQAE